MLDGKNVLKRKLAQRQTAYGLWVTLEAPTITEIAVSLGMDYVVVDSEHGQLDFKELLEHIRVCRNTPTTPLVRIPEIEQGTIKRVLDLGAEGILVPQVYNADEVRQAVRFAKYPPWGIRGVGGERATEWGMQLRDRTRSANDETLVIPLLETVEAGQNLAVILEVKGVDAIQFGPADYSSSAGYLGEWEGPGVAAKLVAFKDQIRSRGIPCGILATDIENAVMRKTQGFQMIAVGTDTGFLIRGLRDSLQALAGKRG
jgi:2-keto-3-deoxy-L-rhamnonate aldolase RhmA